MDLSYFSGHQGEVLTDVAQHARLGVIALAIALAIAVPLGTLIARFPILYTPVMALLGIIYTIPSLALLALLVPVFGIGALPATIALVAYAQFVLVRNVVVGLREVDSTVVEAARAMGMNGRQILFRIEYPLALPVILAGFRIATVATIAITSVAAYIDAGGLGSLLFNGIGDGYGPEILAGAVAISLLAVAADLLLRLVDRLLPASRARAAERR
jgi:osmoprotectant transport system permease protein